MAGIPNMRRVYGRPWQRGAAANPGKVSTGIAAGIAVGVRPETTRLAHETMPDALADTSTTGARLAGAGGIDVPDRDPSRPGLVFDRRGAIPPNLLQFPNTESNSSYLRACQMVGAGGHPSRFPKKLPEFFIRFLTDEGDTVLDLFAGSNTTGAVAETLGRRWVAFEIEQSYLAGSAFRFPDVSDEATVRAVYHQLMDKGARGLRLPPGIMQGCLFENDGRKNSGGFQRGDGGRSGGGLWTAGACSK